MMVRTLRLQHELEIMSSPAKKAAIAFMSLAIAFAATSDVFAAKPTKTPRTTTTVTTTTSTTTNPTDTTTTTATSDTTTTTTTPTTTSDTSTTTTTTTSTTTTNVVYDNRVGLGSDSNGIPILEKHPNARYIYWNPALANASDTNPGTDPNYPKLTLTSAWSALRDGYGDWLLLAKGTTWPEGFGYLAQRNGLSNEYPIVVTTYDPTDPNNISKFRQGSVTIGTNMVTTTSLFGVINASSKVVLENIIFDNAGYKNVQAALWSNISGTKDSAFMFHNVTFKRTNMSVQNYSASTSDRIGNVIFRHCAFIYAWQPGAAHAQGLYLWKTDGVTIEDSIFYHNGWQTSRDEIDGADIFKHNAYFGTLTFNTIFRRNVSGHSSSHGLQLRGGGIAEDNVFASNPINLLIGGGDSYATYRPDGVPYIVRNNIITGSSDINSTNPRGFGLIMENTQDNGVVDNNIIANIGTLSHQNWFAFVPSWLSVQYNLPTYVNLTNNIFWNWNPDYTLKSYSSQYSLAGALTKTAYPSQLHFTYSGNIIHFDTNPAGTNKQYPVTSFPDPERNLTSYASANNYISEDALWIHMTTDTTLPWAKKISDYIRAGFSQY